MPYGRYYEADDRVYSDRRTTQYRRRPISRMSYADAFNAPRPTDKLERLRLFDTLVDLIPLQSRRRYNRIIAKLEYLLSK